MTYDEIIKAFECCVGYEYSCMCEECPLDIYPQCEAAMYRETVDLINRQKTEIKQKDTEIDILIRKKETLKDELAEKQAEVERLKPFEEKIAEYNSSIRVEDMLVFASSLEEWLEFCDNLKAEARKEFAERLKEKVAHIPAWGAVAKRKIDNLLEEMESERE